MWTVSMYSASSKPSLEEKPWSSYSITCTDPHPLRPPDPGSPLSAHRVSQPLLEPGKSLKWGAHRNRTEVHVGFKAVVAPALSVTVLLPFTARWLKPKSCLKPI